MSLLPERKIAGGSICWCRRVKSFQIDSENLGAFDIMRVSGIVASRVKVVG